MKELGFTLTGFTTGLRKDSNVLNADSLVQCYNAVPRSSGLFSPTQIPQTVQIPQDFPYPQIFFGITHWICCTRDKIYFVNPDYSLTEIVSLTASQQSNELWQLADFHYYVLLTNTVVTIYANQDTRTFKVLEPSENFPNLSSVCNFNGQILGSPSSTWYDATANTLIWSKIGSAKFAIDRSNTSGYRPMPWTGIIYQIRKLGIDYFIVYGSGGIAICKFSANTPGIVRVLPYGIASRGAVGGDDYNHLFIDTSGNLRMLNSDLVVSDGDYQEFFSPLLGSEFIVSWDIFTKDFYISTSSKCYVKTLEGLGEVNFTLTSLDSLANTLIGITNKIGENEVILTTDQIDFGSRGRKTIDTIEFGVESNYTIDTSIYWKMDTKSSYSQTDWRPLNSEGVITFPLSGVSFMFSLRCNNKEGFKCNNITLRIKFDDNRFKRGVNVSKITA